jgi:hypothetical protein
VVTARALEYPRHVLVKARGRPLADGRPLPALNGASQALQRVIDPLLRRSRDAGRAAGTETDRREHSLASRAPAQVLADDVKGVTDQEPARLVGEPAQIRLDISRLIPLVEVERVPSAHGVGSEKVGGGDARQECPRLPRRERVQAQLKRRPAVQSALRAQHLFHHADGRAGKHEHHLLIPDPVFPNGRDQVGYVYRRRRVSTIFARRLNVDRRIGYYDAPKASALVPSVNVVLAGREGCILLIRRADNGKWALPAGRAAAAVP